jgi:hypothetical protein
MNKAFLNSIAEHIRNNIPYDSGRLAASDMICDVMNKRGKRWNQNAFRKACNVTVWYPYSYKGNGAKTI